MGLLPMGLASLVKISIVISVHEKGMLPWFDQMS